MNFSNDMTTYAALAAIGLIVLLVAVVALVGRRKRPLNREKFMARWQEIQALCKNKESWPLAIINADKLLDDALKQRRFKGKTMGERMVAAQHSLSENDQVWYGHKLRNRLVHEETPPLKKKEVIRVLTAFRQALKDLGAL
jgi:hypothetical protein